MCFGKPQKNASPQEKSGPPQASQHLASGPRPVSSAGRPRTADRPQTADRRPVSRRQSRPVAQGQNHIDPQSREGHRRRPHSMDRVERPRSSHKGGGSKRQSGFNSTVQQEAAHDSDRGITIAVMGITGAGKSYFIREVTGNSEIKVSGSLYSSTSKVQGYSFDHLGERIILVDTPGFDDTNRTDTEVLKEIADWTSKTYKKKQLLSGIIYLHPITHTRMEGSAMRNLRMFQRLCGQEVLENVLLTTTQWSKVDRAEGEFREENLRDEGLWGGLIGKGATLRRFHGTKESGLELVSELVSKTRKPLNIQDQIVEQRMTILETDAGKFLNEGLAVQEKRFREELESLEKQLREAIKAKDNEMNQILTAEQTRAEEKLERAAAERRWLEGLHAAEIEKRKAKRGKVDGKTVAGPSRPRPKTMHF